MAKADEAHEWTEEELEELEKRIAGEYKKAADELQEKIDDYFQKFAIRDKAMRERVEAGEITDDYYKQWRLAQIGRGERFEALRDRVAERMTKANEVAAAYINDATPGIYSLNRNYAAYTIEQAAGDVGFDLWDEQTVKRLIVEQPDLMPYYPPARAVKRGIDLAWGKRQITAQVTSGILQGESIKQLSDRLQTNIPTMNRNSAIRTARTSVTSAQNAGRYAAYKAAKDMGVKLKVQWLATLDGRTRHSHGVLDGQTREVDEPFEVDGQKILYPGYTLAVGSLIYNCRCTIIALVNGVDMSSAKRFSRDPVTGEIEYVSNMTYSEYMKSKREKYGDEQVDTAIKKAHNQSADKKQWEAYKTVLGKEIPGKFSDFQKMKYSEPEKWSLLKTKKRQTDFVNNAGCVTTPRKYSGYFLKPGAKHAEDFFSVGYSHSDALRLRYDMASQFDMEKAVDFLTNEKGEVKFNIYMQLGTDSKKRFRTCWQKDTPDSVPRIITAFRDDK